MITGEWFGNILREAKSTGTLYLLIGFVVALILDIRVTHAKLGEGVFRLRGTAILLLLNLLALVTASALASIDSRGYYDAHIVVVVLATLVGINVALRIIFDGLLRWVHLDAPAILIDVVAAGVYLVATIILLSREGINLAGLIATSAVLTAVIGLALQDTLGNLASGLALQLEKSVRVGDWLKYDDIVGKVIEVRWRQTTIETRNWETIIIPNSLLAKNKFLILGRRTGEPLQWRRWVRFDVDYRFKPTEVIETAISALRRAPITNVAAKPPPDCVLMNVQGSYNEFAVRYWLTDLAKDDPTDSVVRERLFFALQRAGIPLALEAHAVFLTNETEERRQRKASHSLAERHAALRGIDLFASLDDDDIRELAVGMRYTPFAEGESMTKEGTIGHDLYLVFSGEVSIRVGAGEREREVARLGAGSFFGERSLMTGEVRSATTVAASAVVAYRLAKIDFEKVLHRRPELAEEFAVILAKREDELESVKDDIDERVRKHKADDAGQILTKIRSFFGL